MMSYGSWEVKYTRILDTFSFIHRVDVFFFIDIYSDLYVITLYMCSTKCSVWVISGSILDSNFSASFFSYFRFSITVTMVRSIWLYFLLAYCLLF